MVLEERDAAQEIVDVVALDLLPPAVVLRRWCPYGSTPVSTMVSVTWIVSSLFCDLLILQLGDFLVEFIDVLTEVANSGES